MSERTQKLLQSVDSLEKVLFAFKNALLAMREQINDQLHCSHLAEVDRQKVNKAIDTIEENLRDYRDRFNEAMDDLERWEDESPAALQK